MLVEDFVSYDCFFFMLDRAFEFFVKERYAQINFLLGDKSGPQK